MTALSTGLALGPAGWRRGGRSGIVAWGDSLSLSYTDSADALFVPPRAPIANRAVGGQTSTQIAARQGGVPIAVSVNGNTIPPSSSGTVFGFWDFADGDPRGWSVPGATVESPQGALRVPVNAIYDSLVLQLGTTFAGETFRIEFDVTSFEGIGTPGSGGNVQVGLSRGSWLNGVAALGFQGVGHYDITTTAANDNGGMGIELSFYAFPDGPGFYALKNIRITRGIQTPPPVALTARTVSPVTYQGPWADSNRRLHGRLSGVKGYLERAESPDDSGNNSAAMFFHRTEYGPATPAPAGSLFEPDDARQLRSRTAWIWAGRNNLADATAVKADIAAMVAHLPHDRFLVASVLNAATEGVGTTGYQMVTTLNTELSGIYGGRFVDVRNALLQAHDGTTADLGDVASGVIPRSLRTDPLHLNEAGSQVAAQAFVSRHIANGW